MTANDKDIWRDARLKKALDSAPDADARPGDALREAILQQARMKVQGIAPQPAARPGRGVRAWRWGAGALTTAGALVLVLMVRQEAPLPQQMPTPMAQAPAASENAPVVVAQAPARPAAEGAEPIDEPAAKSRARRQEAQLRADASSKRQPAELSRAETAAAEHARSAAEPAVLADAAPAPAPVVAAAPPAPAAAPMPASPPLAMGKAAPAPAGSSRLAEAAEAWTTLRVSVRGGPVVLARAQLPPDTVAHLTQLRGQAAAAPLASAATRSAFDDKPTGLAGLRIEFLQNGRPVGSLNLGSEQAGLREQLESAARKAAASAQPASAASAEPD